MPGVAIIGVGAVGLVMGARLARAGHDPLLVTRRPEQARRIEQEGVRVEDPTSGRSWSATVRAAAGLEEAAPALQGRTAILCLRTAQLGEAAHPLARLAPGITVANAQNGMGGDALLASLFPAVIGVVVRLTSTRLHDAAVRVTGAGRLVLGAHPAGAGPEVESLAEMLRSAGYEVGVSQHIAEDRWLKLCINLMSAPNALIRREDHTTRAFVEIKARLLEEARAILAVAGIDARSCDRRDRSLDEEIDHQRASLAAGTSARRLPIYNQVWQALSRGGALEADGYHQRILELARTHAQPAPLNQRVLEVLEDCVRRSAGPESVRASEILEV
jgi:2-dehydropantoate 2-reductase